MTACARRFHQPCALQHGGPGIHARKPGRGRRACNGLGAAGRKPLRHGRPFPYRQGGDGRYSNEGDAGTRERTAEALAVGRGWRGGGRDGVQLVHPRLLGRDDQDSVLRVRLRRAAWILLATTNTHRPFSPRLVGAPAAISATTVPRSPSGPSTPPRTDRSFARLVCSGSPELRGLAAGRPHVTPPRVRLSAALGLRSTSNLRAL